MAALKDSDWGVREAAARTLRVIGWRPGTDEAGALYWLYIEEWGKSIEIGAFAIPTLIASLKDGRGDVRKKAAYALGRIGDARAVQPLIVGLGDTEPDLRSDAAYALGLIGDALAAEPLIAALKDSQSSVRKQAAHALGKIGDARAAEALIAATNDGDPDVRSAATYALTKISDVRAAGPLITALKSGDSDLRKRAAKTLESIGWQPSPDELGATYWMVQERWDKCVEIGAPAVTPLIASLKDNKRDFRQAAIGALVRIGAPAVSPLIALFKNSNGQVRDSAADALGQIGDARAVTTLVAALDDGTWGTRSAAGDALARIGRAAIAPLTAVLKDRNWVVRHRAADALDAIGWRPGHDEIGTIYWTVKGNWDECVQIGAPAVAPLIAMLKDILAGPRAGAAETLGRIGDRRAVESLIASLKDEEIEVIQAAAGALGKIGDARAVEPLVYVNPQNSMGLHRDTELSKLNMVVTDALFKIGAKKTEPLIVALKERDRLTRYRAASVLDHFGWQPSNDMNGAAFCVFKGQWNKCVEIGAPAIEPLCDVLRDESGDVRTGAARALGQIGDARAVISLAVALEDKEENVRSEAANALAKIGTPAVDTLVTALESKYWWEPALALAKIGNVNGVLRLIRGFGDQYRGESAVRAVAGIGAAAVPPLVAVLKRERAAWVQFVPSRELDEGLVEALVTIGAPAVTALIASLKERGGPDLAAIALGRIGDRRAVDPLVAALSDHVSRVSGCAAHALDKLSWRPSRDREGAAYWVAKQNGEKCIEMGALSVEPLISRVRQGEVWAAPALGKIGDARAVEPLINLLGAEWPMRKAAAESLVHLYQFAHRCFPSQYPRTRRPKPQRSPPAKTLHSR
jgi:HEAT repeat protein